SDKRYADMKAQLDQLAAQRAAAGTPAGDPAVAPVAPAPAPVEAAPPEKRDAPAWTADQKQWIAKYESKFSGDAPMANPGQAEQENDLIGSKLPQTRFLSAAGGVIDLNDYTKKKQKVVLVMLRGFSGSICLYCSAQTLAMTRAEAEFKKRNTQVVLVYPGKADTVPMFLDAVSKIDPKTPLTYPVGMDVDLAAVHLFRIRGELAKPASLILDENGVVRYAYVGANPADRPSVKDLLTELDKQK
ncbi:MAG TPA: redoxin domain-containing protein, partial [Planctomycetota bacterium]|nr:redoxin domain-containing protein [Planctomycetota bacterium]